MIQMNTPWWDGFWDGVGTCVFVWYFNMFIVEPCKNALRTMKREAKKKKI